MSQHPLNLGLRFLLELAALVAMGYWGWTQHEGILQWLLTILVPLLFATTWGAFRYPQDHGKGLIAISGKLRLLLEFVFFTCAVVLLAASQQTTTALIFATILLIHYALSYDRVRLLAG